MLRIFSAAALLAVVAVGCGASQPQRAAVHRVPHALAQDWEHQASLIATAASAGDSCRARRLASSLRADVRASRARVPSRLRTPLLSDVNTLADRITCTPPPPKPSKPPKPPPEQHGHHGHHGDGNGGGNEQ